MERLGKKVEERVKEVEKDKPESSKEKKSNGSRKVVKTKDNESKSKTKERGRSNESKTSRGRSKESKTDKSKSKEIKTDSRKVEKDDKSKSKEILKDQIEKGEPRSKSLESAQCSRTRPASLSNSPPKRKRESEDVGEAETVRRKRARSYSTCSSCSSSSSSSSGSGSSGSSSKSSRSTYTKKTVSSVRTTVRSIPVVNNENTVENIQEELIIQEDTTIDNTLSTSMPSTMTPIVTSMLSSCQAIQEERIILNIGGTCFQTSKVTLRADPTSVFAFMLLPQSPFRPNTNTYFFDRDPAHFRFVLNYLRNGCCLDLNILPREQRYLQELLTEAKYYKLMGLQEVITTRLCQVNSYLYPMEAVFDNNNC